MFNNIVSVYTMVFNIFLVTKPLSMHSFAPQPILFKKTDVILLHYNYMLYLHPWVVDQVESPRGTTYIGFEQWLPNDGLWAKSDSPAVRCHINPCFYSFFSSYSVRLVYGKVFKISRWPDPMTGKKFSLISNSHVIVKNVHGIWTSFQLGVAA